MEIVDGKQYIDSVKELIIEYTKFLNRNLDFQGLDEELKDFSFKCSACKG